MNSHIKQENRGNLEEVSGNKRSKQAIPLPETHELMEFNNPLRNLAGNNYVKRKPSNKKMLDEILNAMAQFKGTGWMPVSIDGGYDLMLNQCPGACGHVWKLNIKDRDTAAWLCNEMNSRRLSQRLAETGADDE